jgi:hypothetical protein
MSATAKSELFDGSTPLSGNVFLFEPTASRSDTQEIAKPSSADTDPTVVVFYAWGGAVPKHIMKYVDTYRDMFPLAHIIVVTGDYYSAMFDKVSTLAEKVSPAIKYIFDPTLSAARPNSASNERLLLHAMSNVGMSRYVASLWAYQKLVGISTAKLPYDLLIFDSTPGTGAADPLRWSIALAHSWKDRSPLPMAVMQPIYYVFVTARYLLALAQGRGDMNHRLRNLPNDTERATTAAPRLYMYGIKDQLIEWREVERHMAESAKLGFKCETEVFQDSNHVSHMRVEPQKYWGAVRNAWTKRAARL